jgi:hypothetical protein
MMPDDSVEEWLPVERANGHYEVSNLGRVRRAVAGRTRRAGGLIKAHPNRGYLQLHLYCGGGKPVGIKVHTLVAEAFLGPKPSPSHQVNHLDGVKTNNRVANLEWTTPRGNFVHAINNGLVSPVRGERHAAAKLSERQVRAIRKISREFSQREIAEVLGIEQTTISAIRSGKTWKHVV